MKELADRIKMDRMHVSAQVSLLVRRSFVTSAPLRGARNHRRLTLTAHGMTALMDALPLWQKADEKARDLFDHVDLGFLSSLAARDAEVGESAQDETYEEGRLLVLERRD